MRHSEREKNVLVDELTAQNARLTSQLEAANQLEIQLNSKLQEVKNQYTIQHTTLQVIDKRDWRVCRWPFLHSHVANDGRSIFICLKSHFLCVQNHVNGLESLKDELNMITKTKNELEKRLQTTVIEKETIFASLEEALDRIHTLERHVREQDNKLKVSSSDARKFPQHVA